MKRILKILAFMFFLGGLIAIHSCKDEPEVTLSGEKDILSFTVPGQTGPATINATNLTVVVEVECGTDLSNLAPTFNISEKAMSSPESGTAADYSDQVTITVTAENGTTAPWKVTISKVCSNETDILSFTLPEQSGDATINSDDHTVAIEVAEGTDVTDLTPTFTLSAGATSDPASETAGDYSDAVTITVTAADGTTTQDWTVNVTEAVSTMTDILTFTMPGQTGAATINSDDHTVAIEVAAGTDVTDLTPTFTLSAGATSDPASETAGDYSSLATITVTAQDGTTTQDWTVNVTVRVGLNDATDILTFTLPEQTGDALILNELNKLVIKVAAGTDLTNLTPTFTLSAGATSVPTSGTAGDYSSDVTITVTAEDGTTTREWIAKVLEEGTESSENDILTFTLPEQTGPASINVQAHSIVIEVANGTDRTTLTPTFTISEGATADPASGTLGDYSSQVTIMVTAEDGTTQDWFVNVNEANAASSGTDILTFFYYQQEKEPVIDYVNHTVELVVMEGVNLSNNDINPSWTLSEGATSEPMTSTFIDYSVPVIITVTAADGTTTQEWTVNASEAGPISDATDITEFTIPERTGPPTIDYVAHTIAIEVANGTDLTNLTAFWALSDGATSSPVSGTTSDYSSPFIITVTAEDGTTTQDWTVNVTEEPASDAADILAFILAEQTSLAVINKIDDTITIEVENGTDLTNLTPSFVLSPGATSVPASGTTGDYSSDVTITVTAADGTTTKDWTVTVTERPGGISDQTDILSFQIEAQVGDAVIDGVKHEIHVVIADGTQAWGLIATWTLSPGAVSTPPSGAGGINWDGNQGIFVTAEDGTQQTWTVYVTEECVGCP